MIAPHTLSNFQSLTKLIASIINAPHTLANFQSLPKLIALIINHFYSCCRGDWQIALTKQNFSDSLSYNINLKTYFWLSGEPSCTMYESLRAFTSCNFSRISLTSPIFVSASTFSAVINIFCNSSRNPSR